MKIGDEIYVRGIVDEIRGDTVIIKNEGGYFGTSKTEVIRRDQEWDGVAFDVDKFIVVVDKGKIHVLRKGPNKVIIERPIPYLF